jgi:hypothetical protein
MDSQIVVPPSFMSLFVPPGRLKPNAPHAHIAQRYELCEDLAQLLTEQARELLWKLGVDESDVLERMHRGLAEGEAGLEPGEALWVVRRLAELLDWPWPGWFGLGEVGGPASGQSG